MNNIIHEEFARLFKIDISSINWPLSFFSAMASGLPFLIGTYFDHVAYGLLASMGALAFLYLPSSGSVRQKVSVLVAVAIGICICYALGFIAQLIPTFTALTLAVITIIVAMLCKACHVGPPGNLFFVMVAFMGAYSKIPDTSQMLLNMGLFALGGGLACLVGFFFSLLQNSPTSPAIPFGLKSNEIRDSILFGFFIFLALLISELFHLEPIYWVSMSCLIIMQETSMALIWRKKIQRIIGTAIGVYISYYILNLFPMDKYLLPAVIFFLVFMIAIFIRSNYVMACVFITVQAIVFTESADFNPAIIDSVLNARLVDTIIGCFIGMLGGLLIHKLNSTSSPVSEFQGGML